MTKKKDPLVDDFCHRLRDALPPSVRALGKDIEQVLCDTMQATFEKLNVVTREEFDAQTKVLARLREKIEQLEHELANLEKRCP